ncbi:MAG: CvpA family protein [Cytophagaceae bacterium]
MEIIDIVIVLLLVAGGYAGYKKGFLLEIVTFFAFVIAIISGFRLMQKGIELLEPYISSSASLIPYIAFILIFILTFVAIYLLGRFLRGILHYTLFGRFDQAAGAFLGVLKTAFFLSLFFWLSYTAQIDFIKEQINVSLFNDYLVSFAPATIDYLSYVIPFQDIFSGIQKVIATK